jgi:hypothetical protein
MDIPKIEKALKNPIKSYNYIRLLLKGTYYKFKFRILNRDVQIGRGFKVRRKLSVKGPGKVIIGNNVLVDGTSHTVTPWTYSKHAEIVIGDNVF